MNWLKKINIKSKICIFMLLAVGISCYAWSAGIDVGEGLQGQSGDNSGLLKDTDTTVATLSTTSNALTIYGLAVASYAKNTTACTSGAAVSRFAYFPTTAINVPVTTSSITIGGKALYNLIWQAMAANNDTTSGPQPTMAVELGVIYGTTFAPTAPGNPFCTNFCNSGTFAPVLFNASFGKIITTNTSAASPSNVCIVLNCSDSTKQCTVTTPAAPSNLYINN